MTVDTTNAYLRNKVFSASPAELRLMLIEGAIRFARQGREGLATKNYELSFNGLTQSKSIILELINCLRPEVDQTLCDRLGALYTFAYRRLIDANLEKSVEIVDEVIELLEYDRQTWVMLLEQLAKEQGENAEAPAGAGNAHLASSPNQADAMADSNTRPTISIEG